MLILSMANSENGLFQTKETKKKKLECEQLEQKLNTPLFVGGYPSPQSPIKVAKVALKDRVMRFFSTSWLGINHLREPLLIRL